MNTEEREGVVATFKNTSGTDLEVWVDGKGVLVEAGTTFDVPEEHADGLRSQPSFKEQVKAVESAGKGKN